MNLHSIFDNIIASLIVFINSIGYIGIFFGMFLESTPFPIPSELVMIPAGIASSQDLINIYLVIFFGVLGNFAGAIFSYFAAASIGRAALFKMGKYFFLKPHKIIAIENFFYNHGKISVFIGRLIPGVRHFISIAAGAAKMDFYLFCFYTFLGSFIWTSILVVIGYFIGLNQDLVKEYINILIIASLAFCVFLVIVYSVIRRRV